MRVFTQSLLMLVLMTLLTGLAYPLLVTAVAHNDGDPSLLGREFTEPEYFWSRPSASAYNGKSSGGTNYGPMSQALVDAVKKRVDALHAAGDVGEPPIDLVTSSGSGLDPHISPEAARYQGARVARARGIEPAKVAALIAQHTQGRSFGLLGEPRVNVVALNRALDGEK
jgi:K+-transporting ATPase ATPase C chain